MAVITAKWIDTNLQRQKLEETYGVGEKTLIFNLLKKQRLILPAKAKRMVNGRSIRLRYSQVFDTPFLDEQDRSEKIQLDSILVDNGRIIAPKGNVCLQKFLLHHPSNRLNGGVEFEVFDRAVIAEKELEGLEVKFKAMEKISLASDVSREIVGRVIFKGKGKWEDMDAKVKQVELMKQAERSPQRVIDAFNDPTLELKNTVYMAINAGYIVEKGGEFSWANGKRIFVAPENNRKIQTFVLFLESDDGALANEQITKEVNG